MSGSGRILLAALWLLSGAASAAAPAVAIIIDDLGNQLDEGLRVVQLPGPVACAVLPHTRYAAALADAAYARGKEVLLHLPMESVGDAPLGPGGITLDMTRKQIQATLRADLATVPHAVGVNNHEGSLLTQHPGDLAWIMQALKGIGGLFYIDSYTSADSVAYQIAVENGVPAARRNVFLDDVDTEAAVAAQFHRLLEIARREGYALAIGHPRPATLAVLAAELPRLPARGFRLVPVGEIVKLQKDRPLPWPPELLFTPAKHAS